MAFVSWRYRPRGAGDPVPPSSGERRKEEVSKEKTGLRKVGQGEDEERSESGEGEEPPRRVEWRGERTECNGLSRHYGTKIQKHHNMFIWELTETNNKHTHPDTHTRARAHTHPDTHTHTHGSSTLLLLHTPIDCCCSQMNRYLQSSLNLVPCESHLSLFTHWVFYFRYGSLLVFPLFLQRQFRSGSCETNRS